MSHPAGAGLHGPTPRRLAPSLYATQLFGGILAQAGWGVFLFGMIFFWAFGARADFSSFVLTDPETAPGRVLGCGATGASENETPVYAIHYVYNAAALDREGTSYATGWCPEKGSAVTVLYKADDPGYARIDGARRDLWPWGLAVTALVPLVGLALALYALLRGLDRLSLLRSGRAAHARVAGKLPTSVRINDRPVYALRLVYHDPSGRQWTSTVKTHEPELLEDEETESLLYDPERPRRAVAVDAIAGGLRADAGGTLRPASSLNPALYLILPLACAAIHGGWALYR